MPRNGSGVYSLPAGSTFAPDTTIESAKVNAINSDLAADANTARPVTAGGTGGATVAAAKAALGFAYDSWRAFPTAGGTTNALTLTLSDAVPSLTTGVTITFTAASSNTTAATLNASALGAKAIRKISGGTDVALAAGDIAAAGRYTVTYDSTANAAAGAWILVGNVALASTTDVLTNTDATKAVTPDSLYAIWGKGIDVTAASTLTLGEGGLFNVIGDTGITDIDFAVPADGRRATLIFEGAPLLTHNATTLNLPGGENIQVVAGDRCDVVQDDADNVYITNYTPGSASPYRIGDWTPAFSATGSTFNYATQSGRFIKIGKMVQLWGRIDLATSGNTLTANTLTITGLPFTSRSGNSQLGGMTQWSNTTTSYIAIRLSIPAGGTTMTMLSQTAAATTVSGGVVASGLHATSGTVFIFTATYEAA